MNEPKKDDPTYAIMVMLLIWALMLALGVAGQVLKLLTERGCT